MIRVDAVWMSTQPLDMRAGPETALARVVQVFGAARPHHAYLFANARANRLKVLVHDGFGVWLAARRLNQGKFVWGDERLGPQLTLSAEQLQTLQHLATSEAEADRLGEHALAIRLSGEFHQAMAHMHGNPVLSRWLNGLLPTTSLLMSRFKSQGGQVCVAHRHVDLIAALQKSPASAGAEMRKHLNELEQSLTATAAPRRQLRDVFQAYRDSPE